MSDGVPFPKYFYFRQEKKILDVPGTADAGWTWCERCLAFARWYLYSSFMLTNMRSMRTSWVRWKAPGSSHGLMYDGWFVDDDGPDDGVVSSSEVGSYKEGVVTGKEMLFASRPECSSILGTEYRAKRFSWPEVGPGVSRTRTPMEDQMVFENVFITGFSWWVVSDDNQK